MRARTAAAIVIAISGAACGLPGATSTGAGGAQAQGSGGATSSSTRGAGPGGGGHHASSSSGNGGGGGAPLNAFRRPITVTAAGAAVPGGYSIAIVLDHQTLVGAGKSLASGDDVRVFREGNPFTELDRVLGLETQWNTASTELWFRSSSPIAANGDDAGYYLYYGDPAAVMPPADPNKVHLFFDDFENGLGHWTDQLGGFGAIDGGTARSGASSLKVATVGSQNRWLTANGVDVSDVSVDAYWRVSDTSGFDISQGVHASATMSMNDVETNFVSNPGFDVATETNDSWSELVSPVQPGVSSGTWLRVTTSMVGTKFKVLVGGVPTVPASGWTNVTTAPASGSVSLRAWKVPGGQAWWVDDVRARKLVDPEPTAALGTEEPAAYPP